MMSKAQFLLASNRNFQSRIRFTLFTHKITFALLKRAYVNRFQPSLQPVDDRFLYPKPLHRARDLTNVHDKVCFSGNLTHGLSTTDSGGTRIKFTPTSSSTIPVKRPCRTRMGSDERFKIYSIRTININS